ncbi:VOC family protein [Breznakiella homolactica]|uniref:VOC family protein n=1 Tax=Breznakiella homolactica TaxID=2798577 RepID=A0A7T7XN73_9SPIR|nr:VOC family protein [Breznakiella homolactica]QQO09445.1 VOC family protein [Breznakiella homolactica]
MKQAHFLNRSIGQIGYVVEDVEQTVRQYHERFGIGGWHFYTYAPPLLKFQNYRGKPIVYSARIALGYFGDTRIELIQNLEGRTIYTDFIEEHGYGVQHLGIYVPDMQEALEDAGAAGFSVVMEGGGFGLDGDGHFAYLDTEKQFGTTYELIQRPKRRHEPEMVYPKE